MMPTCEKLNLGTSLSVVRSVEPHRQFVVLLVEDSDEDVFLFERALKKTGRPLNFQRVSSAQQAQHYLLGDGQFHDRAAHPLPSVIFTDLNLHGLDGLSFLEWLRAQPDLRVLPCIIYSGSHNPSDVQSAYATGATSFVIKPSSFAEWVARLETVLQFWMDVAQPPQHSK